MYTMKPFSKTKQFLIWTVLSATLILSSCQTNKHYDVIVAGGGTSGTCAAIQSARLGTKTLLIEPSSWLGGMLTSAGVSAVDGNYHLPSGLWGEFLDALSQHYGSLESLRTGWVSNVLFEPSVGNQIFQQWVAAQPTLKCAFHSSIEKIKRSNNGWNVTVRQDGKIKRYHASYLIDATELGDVAKAAGLPYHAGMDASSDTGEPQAPAMANHIAQDMTYVFTVKKYATPHLIARPEGYDPLEFRNCCLNRYNDSTTWQKPVSAQKMLAYGCLPHNKFMLNWPLFGNDIYQNDIEYTTAQRDSLHQIAKAKSIRFLYFLQHELGMTDLDLADDEYPTADKLPFIPYYREGRRFQGVVRFTLNDILQPYAQANPLYRTAIGVGDYPVDHHHHCYTGKDLPDIHFPSIPSYGVPLGIIIPQKEDRLLLAEKAVSVTNLVNGTTRLQPVSMQIGQAAGVLAALAVKDKCTPRDVPVHLVQRTLLEAGSYLLPYLDVEKSDPAFKSLQRIGVMGILHGKGKPVSWSNQTWLNADSTLYMDELSGLASVYPKWKMPVKEHQKVMLSELLKLIQSIASAENIPLSEDLNTRVQNLFENFHLGKISSEMIVTRKQAAVLIDQILSPFDKKEINLFGNILL